VGDMAPRWRSGIRRSGERKASNGIQWQSL